MHGALRKKGETKQAMSSDNGQNDAEGEDGILERGSIAFLSGACHGEVLQVWAPIRSPRAASDCNASLGGTLTGMRGAGLDPGADATLQRRSQHPFSRAAALHLGKRTL